MRNNIMKMKNMTLENIAKACSGTFVGKDSDKSLTITGVEKTADL